MPARVDPVPLSTVVLLVNEWGDVPRRAAGEEDRPRPDVSLLADGRGPLEPGPGTGEAELVSLADRLHAVFAAGSGAERAALVDELLAVTGVRPAVQAAGDGREGTGGAVEETWVVPDRRDALTAACALALRDHIARAAGERLGTCAGDRCADVYVDASPAGRRRFCSLTCQNRTRVAAYRRRRATGPG